MIARFVAKMIDRELNGKPQSEEYSEWDHLERFKFIDEMESSENDEKELALIQSIIGKHSSESKSIFFIDIYIYFFFSEYINFVIYKMNKKLFIY